MSTNPESSLCEVRGPPRQSGPRLYRTATVCLATLCTVLLFTTIALSAYNMNLSQALALQNQTDSQVQMLTAALSRLQAENAELNLSVVPLGRLQAENAELHNSVQALTGQLEHTNDMIHWSLMSEYHALDRRVSYVHNDIYDLEEQLAGCATAAPTAALTEAGTTTAVPIHLAFGGNLG